MRIAGIQKYSLIDFPETISAVVFTQGCNMRCGYCHNSCLIEKREDAAFLDEEEVLAFLKKRQGMLDGVVITGGEPTLQKDLEDFIKKIRSMDYNVKLDTNGTNPILLKRLIYSGLLDYVAMDVKAPFFKYDTVCGSRINIENVKRSVEILMENKVEYEFRTTYVPELEQEDLLKIARFLTGAKRYVIQQYREVDSKTGHLTGKVYTRNILKDIFQEIKNSVKNFHLRGDFNFT